MTSFLELFKKLKERDEAQLQQRFPYAKLVEKVRRGPREEEAAPEEAEGVQDELLRELAAEIDSGKSAEAAPEEGDVEAAAAVETAAAEAETGPAAEPSVDELMERLGVEAAEALEEEREISQPDAEAEGEAAAEAVEEADVGGEVAEEVAEPGEQVEAEIAAGEKAEAAPEPQPEAPPTIEEQKAGVEEGAEVVQEAERGGGEVEAAEEKTAAEGEVGGETVVSKVPGETKAERAEGDEEGRALEESARAAQEEAARGQAVQTEEAAAGELSEQDQKALRALFTGEEGVEAAEPEDPPAEEEEGVADLSEEELVQSAKRRWSDDTAVTEMELPGMGGSLRVALGRVVAVLTPEIPLWLTWTLGIVGLVGIAAMIGAALLAFLAP